MCHVPGNYYVYIMASPSRTLYIGMTNDLVRRTSEHRQKLIPGFSSQYNCTDIVYYEWHADVLTAIAREKELKGWRRAKKVALIEAVNTHWHDLWNEITAHFRAGPG
jgi:putative endonuclease